MHEWLSKLRDTEKLNLTSVPEMNYQMVPDKTERRIDSYMVL